MTDTTELLKYVEGLIWRPISEAEKVHQEYMLGMDADIGVYAMHWRDDKNSWCYTWNQEPCNPTHFMPLPDGQAGEVIKELLHTVLNAKQHQENCVKTNSDALRGTTWHILNNGITRATAILGGDDAGNSR